MKTNLILDASNLIYRTFLGNIKEDQEMTVGLCYHMALSSLAKYYKQYNADDIVIAFDLPNSWRKIYTKDKGHCVTHKVYKANRRQNLTESQKQRLADLDKHLEELAALFKEQSGLIVLQRKYLEADDLIAGYVQKFKYEKHVIISSDKDFLQLLAHGSVTLIDPASNKARDLSEWDYDPKYFMFEKCFRGDAGDNVMSSYPYLKAKKIKTAYTDPLLLTNLMQNEYAVEEIDSEGKLIPHNYVTGKVFEENQLLMDLTMQPEFIRELIDDTIDKAITNRGKYQHFEFLKFCGRHELHRIIENIDKYSALLSGKGKNFT